MAAFNALPAEILMKVLMYLDAHGLLRCQTVCKSLKRQIDQSSALQYSIRLAMCGYKDGPQATEITFSSSAARLEALEKHLTRWKNMDWDEEEIMIPNQYCEALVGGVYAVGVGESIFCFELPSRVRQTPLRSWTHKTTFVTNSLILDPGQDLLVLMEVTEDDYDDFDVDVQKYAEVHLHFRTLSTNENHPRANSPTICFPEELDFFDGREFPISVMGSSVGVVVGWKTRSDVGSLFIFDWCTGKFLMRTAADSFAFIGPRTVILGGSGDHREDAIILSEITNPGTPPRMIYLELPSLPQVGSKPRFSVNADWLHPPLNRPSPGRVFFDSSDAQIVNITVDVVRETGARLACLCSFNLLVPMTVIRRYAHHAFAFTNDRTTVIPWSEWGPENSRLFPLSEPLKNGYYAFHGSRYVLLNISSGYISSLTVIDFTPNIAEWPHPTQPSAQQLPESSCETKVMSRSEPDIVDNIWYFSGVNIVTRLPYHYSQRKLNVPIPARDVRGVLVDDEHILLASVGFYLLVAI